MALAESTDPSWTGLQRHSWQGSRASRQNAQTSSVLTGRGAEGGAVVQAAMMLAPRLCWWSPKCHSGEQFQNGTQQDKS